MTYYELAIVPLYNANELYSDYGSLVDYLNENLKDVHFVLTVARNYEDFDVRLYSGQVDFALGNPYEVIRAIDYGYRAFAKMGDDANFKGLIFVRRDSNIKSLDDLKGKKVSYPAKSALASTMMPQYFLQTHGIDVNSDIDNLYVKTHESSLMNVYNGNVAAGATWLIPWLGFQRDHPHEAAALEVKWETPTLINNGFVARSNFPPELIHRVAELLTRLHETPKGKAILGNLHISRFEPATDATYDVVRKFVTEYESTVHPPAN